MTRVAVVTDSSTCLPAELVESLGVIVLPISVHLPEGAAEEFLGSDGSALELPESLELEELTGANHPFVTEYLEAIETPGYDAAVVVTPAVEFAPMYRNAVVAAELATRPTTTVDTRTAAAGQALVVLAGARAAAAGAGLEEVVRTLEEAARRVELVASLATLDPIRRSGPLPDELLGDELASTGRSLFRMRDGSIEPLESNGSAEASLATIVDAYRQSTAGSSEATAVFHAGVPALAAALAEELGEVDFVSGFSIAMQIHTGPGVVGAAWLPCRAT